MTLVSNFGVLFSFSPESCTVRLSGEGPPEVADKWSPDC